MSSRQTGSVRRENGAHPPLPFVALAGWVRTTTTTPQCSNFAYRHRWSYRRADGSEGAFDLVFSPRRHRPRYRVTIRASLNELLDLRSVYQLTRQLEVALQVNLLVAEAELTYDSAGGQVMAEALARHVYAPRIRRRADLGNRWWAWGSRRSESSVRVYFKQEAGIETGRLEVVFRRGILRTLGVNEVPDLASAPWAALCDRKLRLVDFVPSRQARQRIDQARLLVEIREGHGVSKALEAMCPQQRRWFRSRLFRSSEHHRFMALLRSFSARLRGLNFGNAVVRRGASEQQGARQ